MRCAILADIHSNLAALEAVLVDIKERGGVDQIWCLGDIVGYGPDPGECLRLLREQELTCVAGNHDWAAVGNVSIADFNPDAAAACRWTARQLTPEQVEFLKNLPLTLICDDFTLVHGSPRDPITEYMLSVASAVINFARLTTSFCLIGHSHVPCIFEYFPETRLCQIRELVPEEPVKLNGRRLIINPGGVGQPRDGDPRAAYAIYDSQHQTVVHYRVPYDIAATQERMRRHGLPQFLIARLSFGW